MDKRVAANLLVYENRPLGFKSRGRTSLGEPRYSPNPDRPKARRGYWVLGTGVGGKKTLFIAWLVYQMMGICQGFTLLQLTGHNK
jgi:hypothetical protein